MTIASHKKWVFITILSGVVCGASFFMVTESAGFYERFYPDGSWRGLYLAALLEGFLLILAMIRVGGRLHRFLSAAVMLGIFSAIIFSAGMQAVAPILKTMEKSSAEEKLVGVLNLELKTLNEDSGAFERSRQKGNLALTAVQKRKIFKELKDVHRNSTVGEAGKASMITMGLLLMIRFLIQMANLLCARAIGMVYRAAPPAEQTAPEPSETAPQNDEPLEGENSGKADETLMPPIVLPTPPPRPIVHNKGRVLALEPDAVCVKDEKGYLVSVGKRVLAKAPNAAIAWRKASLNLDSPDEEFRKSA